MDLPRQSSESLAGRVAYVGIGPFDVLETAAGHAATPLWVRGSFPDSFLAENHSQSLKWRHDFILTYLEREETPERLRTMLAHSQGTLLNASASCRRHDDQRANRYIDLLRTSCLSGACVRHRICRRFRIGYTAARRFRLA